MAVRDGHCPYQARIDAYGNSGFRFAEMSHRGSILCLPSGMHAWRVNGPEDLSLDAFAPVLEVADDLDILLIGMGNAFVPLPREVKAAFRERGIVAEPGSTGAMARTYNVLFAEERAVGAALIAVADAGVK